MAMTSLLAYKYVMLAAMVAFVNHYAPRLNLPISVPLKSAEIQKWGARPPMDANLGNIYGGGIRVSNYAFGFSGGGYINPNVNFTPYFGITKLEDDGMTSFGIPLLERHESSISLMERASKMKYKLSTNDMALMTTNILDAFGINCDTFGKGSRLVFEYLEFNSKRGWVPNPLLYARWGGRSIRDPGSNGIAFEVSAISGELLELNMGNAAGCKGLPLVKENDLDKLLSISDNEFQKYSDVDRSNLVVRYSTYVTPEMVPALTNLNYWFPQTNPTTAKDFVIKPFTPTNVPQGADKK